MAGRKQNLVLFFKESEEYNVINSRLVRMYMNRFTIDEEDQTEVTEVYDIKNGTWKEYKECFSKSLRIERENETTNTDTHFILGNETEFGTTVRPLSDAKFSRLIANYPSRLGNNLAFTFLSGSIGKFPLGNNQGMTYQYQKQDEFEQKSFLLTLVHGENWVTEKFKGTINDDLEWFQSRILENGITSNVDNEIIKTFHYQMLDDNQVEALKNSIAKYDKNPSFFKRFYAHNSMEKANSNDTYACFNCKRVTMYFNNGRRKNEYDLWIGVMAIAILAILLSYISRTDKVSPILHFVPMMTLKEFNYITRNYLRPFDIDAVLFTFGVFQFPILCLLCSQNFVNINLRHVFDGIVIDYVISVLGFVLGFVIRFDISFVIGFSLGCGIVGVIAGIGAFEIGIGRRFIKGFVIFFSISFAIDFVLKTLFYRKTLNPVVGILLEGILDIEQLEELKEFMGRCSATDKRLLTRLRLRLRKDSTSQIEII